MKFEPETSRSACNIIIIKPEAPLQYHFILNLNKLVISDLIFEPMDIKRKTASGEKGHRSVDKHNIKVIGRIRTSI